MNRLFQTTLLATLVFTVSSLNAQTNVRAWHAKGQTWVVWDAGASPNYAYSVYRSASTFTSTAQATLCGTPLNREFNATRLKLANSNATWRVPMSDGSTYQLTATEGLFVYTPHAAANEYFAVVTYGTTTVPAGAITTNAVAQGYDPVNDPVQCHVQLQGTLPVPGQGSYPYTVYSMWVDGRDDVNDARPDFPVLANAPKNGAPHMFAIYEPSSLTGLPATPFPATLQLHGGGEQGTYWNWRPGYSKYANVGPTPVGGICIAHDDRVYRAANGLVSEESPSYWFGWWSGMPAINPASPPDNAVVVPYTARRLIWIQDWIETRSAYAGRIDPKRVSVMGNSMGGFGTHLLCRYKPERFSAGSAFVPVMGHPNNGAANKWFGTPEQNLPTTETGRNGAVLHVVDFCSPTASLSPLRDRTFTRFYRGRNEVDDTMTKWGWDDDDIPGQYRALNDLGVGVHLYWDEREHSSWFWATDDPDIPGNDIGQWVAPVRTERGDAAYQAKYRSNQSYPGIFNDDQNGTLPGRQPDIGNRSHTNGAPWGTWSGYYDWDTTTITDNATQWACTLSLVGQSTRSVDNYPGTTSTCDVSVRKPQQFKPVTGSPFTWEWRNVSDNTLVQSGSGVVGANDVVVVSGLQVTKDPNRRRLTITAQSGDTAPSITSTAVTSATVGQPYSYTIIASGSPPPTLSASGLPAWLSLSGNALSGTPPSAGSFGPVTITASNGIAPNATQTFSITASLASIAPQITSAPATNAFVGQPFTYTIAATGAPTPALGVTGLPTWLSLNGNVLSGTPASVGSFGPITITASNGVTPDATQTFSINVTDLDPGAPTNVRAWYAKGQTWVVWQTGVSPNYAYSVYRAATPFTATNQAALCGISLDKEYAAYRLKLADSNATWRVPMPDGSTYQLAADEGLFVYTPHAPANEYFAVVAYGARSVPLGAITTNAVAQSYHPGSDPVTCHVQIQSSYNVAGRGAFPYTIYAMWVDGRDDLTEARPDFPVLANFAKNGAPHMFAIYEPLNGALPHQPFPAILLLHGGGPNGTYWNWRPWYDQYDNIGIEPSGGIAIAHDDRCYKGDTTGEASWDDSPSYWLGWYIGMQAINPKPAGDNAVVAAFTARRLLWIQDWIETRSPYAGRIDTNRVSVTGTSMGGFGTQMLARWRPERFSSACAFVTPINHPDNPNSNKYLGSPEQNLKTTELGLDGNPLRINQFFDPASMLSPTVRDRAFTRIYRGRNETDLPPTFYSWEEQQVVEAFRHLNDLGVGVHLYWDDRDHTPEWWDTDNPGVPEIDIGEWVYPVRTERGEAAYQAKYRSNQSYPGIFNDDQDGTLPGRQPDIGNGSHTNGAPWGTWGGYYDWDAMTITDTSNQWACTMFLIGQSARTVDNYPGTNATADVSVRKPQQFRPATGTTFTWEWRNVSNNSLVQSGTGVVATDDVVIVTGLQFTKDPARRRLTVSVGSTSNTPPAFASTPDTVATVGVPYSYAISMTGTPTPTLSATGLPAWLVLNGNTLAGTPVAAGTFGPITLTASNGVSPNATQSFTLTVGAAPAITSAPITAATAGQPYSYTITTTGSPAPTLSASGLPAWLSLNGNVLSGTPTTAGTSGSITLTASNGFGTNATQSFIIITSAANTSDPSNVRAWSANGQTFIIWKVGATDPLTYDVYRSANPFTSTTQATLAGRLFKTEWQGDRLKIAGSTLTWRIPNGSGGTYQLASDEGLFVFTQHAAASEYFAVVRNGSSAVIAANMTATAVTETYDPVNDRVRCHLQFTGTTTLDYPYSVYALWADGRDDSTDARPDFPILANAAKNGAPHVFAVYEPKGGLPTTGTYPAVLCFHGGGSSGQWNIWAPESGVTANCGNLLTEGVAVAHDDRVFMVNSSGVVDANLPSFWLGWSPTMNPYAVVSLTAAAQPVVPYTQRRVMWIQDWLEQRSPYRIDTNRVSLMGSSMGGAASSMFARRFPERIAAATSYVPPIGFAENTGQAARLIGTSAQNLASTEPAPGGGVLRMNDYWDFAARLSTTQRDVPLMRFYRGRSEFYSDPDTPAWSAATVIATYNDLNATGWGVHLFWDQRDHSPYDWSTEDRSNPYPDIGQRVSPVLTDRPSRTSIIRYRSNQSFPAFFNDDQNAALPGRQPSMGNGDPLDGDLWGTWSGYYDWDTTTITDTPLSWASTVFLTGLSGVSVDNYPGTNATCDLAIRRPQQFRPSPITLLLWRFTRLSDNAVLQSGVTRVEADGLVVVTNLTVFKDPQRTRLEVMAPPVLHITSASTFRVEGAAGLYCALETSTSLASGSWSSALTFTIPQAGVVTGNLPGVAGEPQRLYRLRASLLPL